MTSRYGTETNVWLFGRDEIDLLEEELEDIYEACECASEAETAMERSVMREQLDAEEGVEAELMLRWGPQMLERGDTWRGHAYVCDDTAPLRTLLQEQAARDPLYERAFLWASGVHRFAKEEYVRGSDRTRDMFRVYLNANLIPIKLSIGRAEDGVDDPFSLHVIEKEFGLALTYLDRTLESLNMLIVRGYDLLVPFMASGVSLRADIARTCHQLGSQHPDPSL